MSEAVTRKELFMMAAAGENVSTPKPVTREEYFLSKIADNSVSKYFGEEMATLFDQTVELSDAGGIGMLQMETDLSQIGDTATVTLDGVAYECDVAIPMPGQKVVGNLGLIGEGEDNGLPFCMIIAEGMLMIFGEAGTHSLKIASAVINTIDDKFIPPMMLTVNVIADGTSTTLDRTFDEIREAYNKGMCVIAANGGQVYQLSNCTQDNITFVWVYAPVSASTATLNVHSIEIDNTNTLTLYGGAFSGSKL